MTIQRECDYFAIGRAPKPAKVIDWESREIYRVTTNEAHVMAWNHDITKRSTDKHGRTVWELFHYGDPRPAYTITFTD